VQVRLITITDQQHAYATRVVGELRAAGLRAEADLRNEKLGYKIREAEMQKVPVVLVVGDKEVAAETVAPRRRGAGNLPAVELKSFIASIAAEARPGVPGGVP
jgi:threonyl-tRNA synthetase